MLRTIGLILLIWFLSGMFAQSFKAFDDAATATLGAVEVAANKTAENFDQ